MTRLLANAEVSYKSLGRRPVKVPWNVNDKSCRETAWVCELCNASSIASRSSMSRPCPKKVSHEGKTFWKGLKATGCYEEVINKIGNPELRCRVESALADPGSDHVKGHEIVSVRIRSFKKKSILWCCRCNANNASTKAWNYKPCAEGLITRSRQFWSQILLQGDRDELLGKIQMNEKDQSLLKWWLQDSFLWMANPFPSVVEP